MIILIIILKLQNFNKYNTNTIIFKLSVEFGKKFLKMNKDFVYNAKELDHRVQNLLKQQPQEIN